LAGRIGQSASVDGREQRVFPFWSECRFGDVWWEGGIRSAWEAASIRLRGVGLPPPSGTTADKLADRLAFLGPQDDCGGRTNMTEISTKVTKFQELIDGVIRTDSEKRKRSNVIENVPPGTCEEIGFPISCRNKFAIRTNTSDSSASLGHFPRANKSNFQFFHTFQSPSFQKTFLGKFPISRVVSRGRCNTGLQFICRSLKSQRFSWPLIETQSDLI
jgi:hypothetical protein